jgi:membrane protein implicated in regulation of membrane protease activity
MTDGSAFLFSPQVWLIFAVALILLDLLAGLALFVVSLGAAAIVIAGMLYAQQQGFSMPVLLDDWQALALTFSVLSVACIGLVKLLFQRSPKAEGKDINHF